MTGQTFEVKLGGFADFKHWPLTTTKAGIAIGGEYHDRFYDRRGYYFREGVDPRNYHGRFVPKYQFC